MGPSGTVASADPQSYLSIVTCLGQVRNPSPPWFGGEATSLRTPNRRRALGLLLLDWSSECSTTPLVLSGPDGRPCLSGELLVLVRAGKLTAPNAPNACVGSFTIGLQLDDWQAKETAPNAPNFFSE
jgi:hypothetical protein